MKNLYLSISIVLLSAIAAFAQAPEKMNYQGVARDLSGNVLANDAISLRVTIRAVSASGSIVYRETHSVTTNSFGLFNVQIGGGVVDQGTFSAITWGSNPYYVETEMDASGGSSYTSLGASQLVSVPYALHSKASSSVSGTTNYIPKFTPNGSTLGNSTIFDNGYVGIGTNSPQWQLQVNSPGVESVLQLSATGGSGSGDLDGLLMGSSTNAYLINYENSRLDFGTNGQYRMSIAPAGFVGIGTTTPQWNLQVNSSGVESVLQLSSASSGSGDLDGLLINSGSSGNATITNMEAGGYLALATQGGGMILSSTGNVGVGINPPAAKLDVLYWQNPDAASGAIKGRVSLTTTDMYGVLGQCNATGFYGYGVKGYGGWYGGLFEAGASGTNERYGVYGFAGNTSGTSYGVYGNVDGTGIEYAGYFSGDVYSSGSYLPSDASLKSDIKAYDNAMAMVSSIPVKTYSYKNDGIYGKMNLPEGSQVGIMAQDLETVFPQLVKETAFEDVRSYEDGLVKKEDIETINFKAVNYTGLVPVIVKAMQEQNQKLDAQQQLISELMQRIEALEAK